MKKTRKTNSKITFNPNIFNEEIDTDLSIQDYIINLSKLYKLEKEWHEVTIEDCIKRISHPFFRLGLKEGRVAYIETLSKLSNILHSGNQPDDLASMLFEIAKTLFNFCVTETVLYMYQSFMFLAAKEGHIEAGIDITNWLFDTNMYNKNQYLFSYVGFEALNKIIKSDALQGLPDFLKVRYAIFSQDPVGLHKARAYASNDPDRFNAEISIIDDLLRQDEDLSGKVIVFKDLEPSLNTANDLSAFQKLVGKPLPLIQLSELTIIKNKLESEFPWCKKAIETITRQLEFNYFSDGTVNLRPLLLYGVPGCGKSRFARRLAELLSLPFTNINVGGSADSMLLKGTTRGWSTGRPSIVATVLQRHQIANPLILLDEIDKESDHNTNGRLTDTLHQLLETETSTNWFDEYLLGSCNFSRVNWIATANSINKIMQSLLNRFDVIEIPKPAKKDYPAIFHTMLFELMESAGFKHFEHILNFNDGEIEAICSKASSPRHLKKLVESVATLKLRIIRKRVH